jgi:hypothetical protein
MAMIVSATLLDLISIKPRQEQATKSSLPSENQATTIQATTMMSQPARR